VQAGDADLDGGVLTGAAAHLVDQRAAALVYLLDPAGVNPAVGDQPLRGAGLIIGDGYR
jgi:hypothetical protein